MKSILTGTFAAFVLGAAMASSQTPPAGQTPSGAQPSGGQTRPAGQDQTTGQRTTSSKSQTSTYRGYLRGSAAAGWTISPIDNRPGTSSTAGATATSGAAADTMYSVTTAEGSKVDLASMADQCVEIVGVVAPASGAGRASSGAAGATATAGAGATTANRTLTVTTIKAVEGGCKP